MAYKKWILRMFRVTALAVLAVLLLLFAVVQFQQHLLRWRAERLMADMHQIRLYQSTWADAQRLMHRWGAWGHYDGICTAAECRYEINLMDASWQPSDHERTGISGWLWRHPTAFVLYRWLGGRYSIIHFAFIVQDGTIWRTKALVGIAASPKMLSKDNIGYVLFVEARSQQALRESEGGGWVEGDDDQLSDHPYYKVGQPNGCEGCILVIITYSSHTPQTEIGRLTAFDLSCLTSLISCKRPDELLPIAREWNLYNYADRDNQPPGFPQSPHKPCDIPIWALGRDTITVFVVEAIPTVEQENPAFQKKLSEKEIVPEVEVEEARVKIIEQLKGAQAWQAGTVVDARTYLNRYTTPLPQMPERLSNGKRYILLSSVEYQGEDRKLFVDSCGMQEDTPANRRELEKGFAQNDHLRGPELR
jgi:hypothetical protein